MRKLFLIAGILLSSVAVRAVSPPYWNVNSTSAQVRVPITMSSATALSGNVTVSSGVLVGGSWGTLGQVFMSSGTNNVPFWGNAAAGGAGLILQIVSTQTVNTPYAITSSTHVIVASTTITLSASTSKVIIFASVGLAPQATAQNLAVRIVRDGSTVVNLGGTDVSLAAGPATGIQFDVQAPLLCVDSPGTTSPVKYDIQVITSGAGTGYVNNNTAPPQSTELWLFELSQ